MDIRKETEHNVEWMEREACPSNLKDILLGLLGQSPNPPPPPSSSAEPPQPAAVSLPGGFGGWTLLGAGPPVIEHQFPPVAAPSTMVPAHLSYQPGTRKRCEQQDDEDRVYVKKPPNAFMLFLKEQRPRLKAELTNSGSATVNAVMGERWKLLSEAEQAKYYEQAEEERLLHAQQHPQWSSKDSYGKKRRRIRRSACSTGKRRFLETTVIFFFM
uniref:HMG box domain-containing protein n=1 Tax=Amphilophus citrinellus TaxID=61819 RepID=A0A3Q0R9X3_AMPCI